MNQQSEQFSPIAQARVAGLFYVLTTITGMLAMILGGRLIVAHDPAATAAQVLAHPDLAWIGPACNLLATACYVVVTALLYPIFKRVSPGLSLLAAFFSLLGCAIGAGSEAFDLAPRLILDGSVPGGALGTAQLQELAYLCFRLNGLAYDVAMVFFGFYCVLIGYLAFVSRLLPRLVGALMALAGLGWLTFLSPPLHHLLADATNLTGLLGEGVFALWLLLRGVRPAMGGRAPLGGADPALPQRS